MERRQARRRAHVGGGARHRPRRELRLQRQHLRHAAARCCRSPVRRQPRPAHGADGGGATVACPRSLRPGACRVGSSNTERQHDGQDPGGQHGDPAPGAQLHPSAVLPLRPLRDPRHGQHPGRGAGDHRRQPPQLLRLGGDRAGHRQDRTHRPLPRQEGGVRRSGDRADRFGDGWHPRGSRHRERRAVEGCGRCAGERRRRGDHAAGHHPARAGVLRSGAQGSLGRGAVGGDVEGTDHPRRAVGHGEGVAAQCSVAERAERRRPAHRLGHGRLGRAAEVPQHGQRHQADHAGDHGPAAAGESRGPRADGRGAGPDVAGRLQGRSRRRGEAPPGQGPLARPCFDAAHRVERFGQREAFGMERLADDRALEAPVRRCERRQRDEIVDRRDAPGGDHRGRGRLRDVRVERDVGAEQRAVLAHVGDHVSGAAVVVEVVDGVPQVAVIAAPASPGEAVLDHAVGGLDDPHVQAHGDPVAVRGDRVGAPRQVAQRSRGEVDPGAAGGQRPGERGVVGDPARQLHGHVELADDSGQQLRVAAAAERCVEVDEVDPVGAVRLPAEGDVARWTVRGFAAGLALLESDGAATGDVERGQQREGHPTRFGGRGMNGDVRATYST